MKFGAVAVEECAGAILAHGIRVAGGVFKKGRVLDAEDAVALRDAGHAEVVVARLEADDVAEDVAAATLATALAGEGVGVGRPFTGRCNLLSQSDGLLLVDAHGLDRMNRVDEAMTVASLAAHARVSAQQLLATVKIIPFAVPSRRLRQAEAALPSDQAALRVAAFQPMDVALVQTQLPGTRDRVLDKTAKVIGQRLEALGSRLLWEERCQHREQALTRTPGGAAGRRPANGAHRRRIRHRRSPGCGAGRRRGRWRPAGSFRHAGGSRKSAVACPSRRHTDPGSAGLRTIAEVKRIRPGARAPAGGSAGGGGGYHGHGRGRAAQRDRPSHATAVDGFTGKGFQGARAAHRGTDTGGRAVPAYGSAQQVAGRHRRYSHGGMGCGCGHRRHPGGNQRWRSCGHRAPAPAGGGGPCRA